MKKIFLGLGIVLLLIVLAFGYWVYARMQSYNQFTRGEVVPENVNFQIPFEWVSEHIIVKAKLAGKTHKFLFDTGAGNILFSNRIDINQFEEIGSAESTDSHGKTIDMPFVQIP